MNEGIASVPNIKTPAPMIYLEDNLDEKDQLGYCIDTKGRGFGEKLHAHSCKPRGGDVQFRYDSENERIESETFNNKCVEIIGSPEDGSKLGLLDCVDGSINQSFNYDSELLELRSKSDSRLCLAVGRASRKAGPFMARKLRKYYCNEVSEQYKRWLIVD